MWKENPDGFPTADTSDVEIEFFGLSVHLPGDGIDAFYIGRGQKIFDAVDRD